jgi:glycerol-3-phosphate acyltransferase PlsX
MKKMTRFLVDCFGGDNPPAILKGVSMFKNNYPSAQVMLVGNREEIFVICSENGIRLHNVEIINCESYITGEDNPTEVLKARRNSSMTVGLNALVEKKADVFVSSGNSGALLVGTSLIVRKMPSVRRIAFATVIPKFKGQFLFLDSGANSDCQAEILEQFAEMSSDYEIRVMKISSPKIGLLNIGTETHKGDALRRQTFDLLNSNKKIDFIGNVEPNSVFFSDCDILISDGFCGNIFLKTIEGMVKIYMKLMQNDEKLIDFLETQDHVYLNPKKFAEESYSILLGANLPVIKLHSSVDANGVFNFLRSYKI